MDTTCQLDIALNTDCDDMFNIALVFNTGLMWYKTDNGYLPVMAQFLKSKYTVQHNKENRFYSNICFISDPLDMCVLIQGSNSKI